MSATAIAAAAQGITPSAAAATAPPSSRAWKDGKSFGFHDFLDLINPLQHLPIIGSIYRWATGDEPGEVARVAGDTLYGGPIGLAFGLVATATEDDKGRDLGERTLAAVFGSGDDGKTPSPTAATQTASAAPAAASAQNAAWLSAFPNAAKNAAATPTPAQVASLYSSPPPAQATVNPAQSQAAAPPVLDHPPMPLFRKGSAPIAAPQTTAAAAADPAATDQNPASRAFLQRTAMLERQIAAGRNTAAPQLNNHPVPLQLSGGLVLPPESARPVPASPAAAPTSPAPAAAAAAAGQAASPVAVAPSQFSQKMLDALDKYRQLQQQLDRQNAADSVPGGAGLTP
jgi:hypothetical protein